MPGGRPLKFKDKKELQKKVDEYFDVYCWEETVIPEKFNKKGEVTREEETIRKQVKPYTITGLAVYLDTSRETLMNYEKSEEFFDTIKKAKEKIHNYTEEKLFSNNVAGVIFNLKNNWGWKDKIETEMSGMVRTEHEEKLTEDNIDIDKLATKVAEELKVKKTK